MMYHDDTSLVFVIQFTSPLVSSYPLGVSRVTETFRKVEEDSPGWDKAREVVEVLATPADLSYEQKIRLITLAMQAATESYDFVEFLIAVSDELVGGVNV